MTVLNEKGDGYKSFWGQAGPMNSDFCGCCNPVAIALASNGSIITAEKTIPRLKLYSADGKTLFGMTKDADFSEDCADLIIAVDSKNTIYAADGQAKVIKIFKLATAVPALSAVLAH